MCERPIGDPSSLHGSRVSISYIAGRSQNREYAVIGRQSDFQHFAGVAAQAGQLLPGNCCTELYVYPTFVMYI